MWNIINVCIYTCVKCQNFHWSEQTISFEKILENRTPKRLKYIRTMPHRVLLTQRDSFSDGARKHERKRRWITAELSRWHTRGHSGDRRTKNQYPDTGRTDIGGETAKKRNTTDITFHSLVGVYEISRGSHAVLTFGTRSGGLPPEERRGTSQHRKTNWMCWSWHTGSFLRKE